MMDVMFNPRLASLYATTLAPRDPIPIVRGWNRLEGRPRSTDFERSLRAEVRDPLWFLTRQWQYGEFEGEDAGSPIEALAAVWTRAIGSFSLGATESAYDVTTPLEVRVERESIPFDLVLHTQTGRLFERLLVADGVGTRYGDYVGQWPLAAAAVAGEPTPDGDALLRAGTGYLFDASALIAAVRDGSHATVVDGFSGMTPPEKAKLVAAGIKLLTWFGDAYAQPGAGVVASAWQPDRLGYGFACATPEVRLVAGNYRGGSLDWIDFDAAARTDAGAAPTPQVLSFMPAGISFGGMPNPRYWEMESARTEFGHIDANTNDLAKLLLTEFMLLYSNDWCLFPLELDIGTLTRVHGLLVTDVFGEQTLVRPADRGRDAEWQRWSMFRLTGDDEEAAGLLLAPALPRCSKRRRPSRCAFCATRWPTWHGRSSIAWRPCSAIRSIPRCTTRRRRRSPATGSRTTCSAPACPRTGDRSSRYTSPAPRAASSCSARGFPSAIVRSAARFCVCPPRISLRKKKSRARAASSIAASSVRAGSTGPRFYGSDGGRPAGAARDRAAWHSITSRKRRPVRRLGGSPRRA